MPFHPVQRAAKRLEPFEMVYGCTELLHMPLGNTRSSFDTHREISAPGSTRHRRAVAVSTHGHADLPGNGRRPI